MMMEYSRGNGYQVDEITDRNGQIWRRNDRVKIRSIGYAGKIAYFVTHSIACVVFDTPMYTVDNQYLSDLELVSRRTDDEIPCDVQERAS